MKLILVVDDEFAIAEVLSALLSDEGYHVVTAGNGEEGLIELAKARPDLVLLDLMMPGMDGGQMLARMHGDEALKDIPVVMMTAGEGVPDRPDGVALLRKPFTLTALLTTVVGIIGESENPPR